MRFTNTLSGWNWSNLVLFGCRFERGSGKSVVLLQFRFGVSVFFADNQQVWIRCMAAVLQFVKASREMGHSFKSVCLSVVTVSLSPSRQVIKTGVHTALGVLAREMDWVDTPSPANLTNR